MRSRDTPAEYLIKRRVAISVATETAPNNHGHFGPPSLCVLSADRETGQRAVRVGRQPRLDRQFAASFHKRIRGQCFLETNG